MKNLITLNQQEAKFVIIYLDTMLNFGKTFGCELYEKQQTEILLLKLQNQLKNSVNDKILDQNIKARV